MQNDDYGPFARTLNSAAWLAELLHIPIGNLAPESIIAASRRQTGLIDWGDDSFLERLAVYCRTIRDGGIVFPSKIYLGVEPTITERPVKPDNGSATINAPSTGTVAAAAGERSNQPQSASPIRTSTRPRSALSR